ncbi:MAG TPA: Zn-dependent hydrolase [Bacillales bacterium]
MGRIIRTMQTLKKRLLADYRSDLSHSGINGERLASRLDTLSQIGATEGGGSYRIGFSEKEREAKDTVKEWMNQAGLEIREDGAGNVFGRLSGKQNDLPAVMSGSHVDTVPNGGHFDGTLGVLSALEVVEAWREADFQPHRPFEIAIFTDEEGARFNGGLTGSQAMAGELDLEQKRKLKDIYNVPFDQVMKNYGLSPDGLLHAKRNLKEIHTFVEVHIEQGKRLEKADAPVGIVTGIAGPCWLEVKFKGAAGHAGNTPMNDRKDALVAASEFILKIKSLPESVSSSAVATVGKLEVHPNGANVIPGEVELFVDIRDIQEETRGKLVNLVMNEAEEIADKHGVEVTQKETMKVQPVPIQEQLSEKLAQSAANQGLQAVFLPSGAAHDAMTIGHHLPVAMLFVQSKNGISHNPEEWSSLNDCIYGVHVLKDFLESLVND